MEESNQECKIKEFHLLFHISVNMRNVWKIYNEYPRHI